MDIPPREHLLAPWLPCQGLAMIYAPRGVGKTFFGLEIAYAVATGQRFLRWNAPKARPVLYLDGEMPAADLQQRLVNIGLTRGAVANDSLRILTPDMQELCMPDLSRRDDQLWIAPEVEKADLVVVDNISTLCRSGGNENDADSWEPVQEWALGLRAAGKSVLFIHHAGKGGGQRGTSKREDVLDTVVALKRPPDYDPKQGARMEVHFEKARGFSGEDAESFEASLSEANGCYSWHHQAIADREYEEAIALYNGGTTQNQIAIALGKNKSTISRWVERAQKDGRLKDR